MSMWPLNRFGVLLGRSGDGLVPNQWHPLNYHSSFPEGLKAHTREVGRLWLEPREPECTGTLTTADCLWLVSRLALLGSEDINGVKRACWAEEGGCAEAWREARDGVVWLRIEVYWENLGLSFERRHWGMGLLGANRRGKTGNRPGWEAVEIPVVGREQ